MPSKEEVDEILRARRSRKACYPCASRKVKCNGLLPCSTCLQRGHPDICIVDRPKDRSTSHANARSTGRRKSRRSEVVATSPAHVRDESVSEEGATSGIVHHEAHSSSLPPAPSEYYRTEKEDACAPSFIGANSTASFLHESPMGGDIELQRDMRPALGLQNTFKTYPFMKQASQSNIIRVVNELLPSHSEVLKYSQTYQTILQPFYPFTANNDDLEALLCLFLERTSVCENSGVPVFQTRITHSDVAQLCLLLSILASGAQFSDLPTSKRMTLSREYARRSFHCARLANFLLRPALETIQALLILGHVLQNDGQADAAWALLGTTTRLAQSLGLHAPSTNSTISENEASTRKVIWSTILWQDCQLSLSFDRPPVSALPGPGPIIDAPHPSNLMYLDCMFELTAIGRYMLAQPHTERESIIQVLHCLALLDQLRAHSAQHLRQKEHCYSRQARMEHQIVRLQISYCITMVCRPFLRKATSTEKAGETANVFSRAKESLLETIQAFLDLQSLTVLPLRNWSIIHSALSSAMLLEILDFRDDSSTTRDLQLRLINVLSHERPVEGDSDGQPWLSASHLRGLRALRNTITRRQPAPEQLVPTSATNFVTAYSPNEPSNPPNVLNAASAGGSESNPAWLVGTQTASLPDNAEVLGDLPMDDFGNIDWGFGIMDNDGTLENTLDQFSWGF